MKLNAMLVAAGFLMLMTPGASAVLADPDLGFCLDNSAAEDDGVGANGCTLAKAPATTSTTSAKAGYKDITFNAAGCTITLWWRVSGSSTAGAYTWEGRITYLTPEGAAGGGEPGPITRSDELTVSMLPGTTASISAYILNDNAAADKSEAARTWTCPGPVDLADGIEPIYVRVMHA